MLVVEPLRWIRSLRPTWVALEQVPPVLELWSLFAGLIAPWGYKTWTGVLSAERYGVPQTRKRAILIARLDRAVAPPEPTHQTYVPGEPAQHEESLLGTLEPWVSMAEALGWTSVECPAPTVTAGGGAAGGQEVFARGGRERILRHSFGESSPDSWTDHKVHIDQPAPTVDTKARGWEVVDTGNTWTSERPATAVCGDPRVSPPGYRGRADDYDPDGTYTGERSMDKAVRVTLQEAAVLQGFPPDYPWQGSRTKRFEQVGNAVPPPLARAVLAQVADVGEAREAA